MTSCFYKITVVLYGVVYGEKGVDGMVVKLHDSLLRHVSGLFLRSFPVQFDGLVFTRNVVVVYKKCTVCVVL